MLLTRSSQLTKIKRFSIVELLGVIAIMSIVTAIVATALKPDPFKSATRRMSGVLSKARSYALANRRYVQVQIKKDGNFSQVQVMKVFTDDVGTADTPATVPGSVPVTMPKSVTVTSANDDMYVVFAPNGSATTLPAVVGSSMIDDDNGKYYVQIDDRQGTAGYLRVYINKFTGMTSVGE